MAESSSQVPSLPAGYTLKMGFPSIEEYRHIRVAAGLSPVTVPQAEQVPKGSWHGCYVSYTPPDGSKAISVGMGRIIGDGGWYFHIADMGVLPEHQRKGLGAVVLKHLLEYIKANAPEGHPHVTLFADPPGRKLYRKFGFEESASHDELGMMLLKGWHLK